MAKELRTEIEINAPPERVWRVLMDFASFPSWNPFIQKLEGEAKEGATLEVEMHPPNSRAMTFKPTVLAAEPNQAFRWRGRMGPPGIFEGEHSFELWPLQGDRTRFEQSERFTGVLAPLLLMMVGKSTRYGFEEMNIALKARAEADSA